MSELKPNEELTAADVAFPATVRHLMPNMSDIPTDFKKWDGTKWNKFFNDLFYCGVITDGLVPVDGIDKSKALRHLKCVAGSFEPKHEHKAAAVAYLASLWFTPESTWKPAK